MKSNTFNYSLLAIGVVAAMGITTANAATTSGATSSGVAPINNIATASYSIGTIVQPTVTSNAVTVNVSETANFILYATNGTSATDDKNEDIATTPGATATFEHILINEGNVSDTYNINTTANDDTTIVTATPTSGYAHPANAAVAFVIRQKGGAALTTDQANALLALGQAQSGNLTGGVNATTRNIKLLPGLQAALSYTSPTPAARTGGDIAVGTLTATSSFITNATTTGTKIPTLVNENQTIVRLPTFKIVKSATNNVDLSVANPQIAYTINVTNVSTAYSVTADNFVIRDVLPLGLTLNGNVTAAGATVTSTGRTTDGRVIIDIAVPSLAVSALQAVTFTVDVDKARFTTAGSSVTNNAAVYDKFVGAVGTLPVDPTVTTHYDIFDNTLTPVAGSETTRVPASADNSGGVGEDTAGTTSFSNRAIVLSNITTREIAPTSNATGVTHTTIITNNGQDVEGTNTNPLTFTIADGGLNGAVGPTGPVTITYTPPKGSAGTAITLTPAAGVYTINGTSLPGGIEKGGTVAINYNVVSTTAVVGTNEDTIVTLTAGGNGAPTVAPITDVTNVRGLTLVKSLSLDAACNADVSTATFGQTAINGAPDQCVIYRIQATNTSSAIQITNSTAASGFNITALEIKDLFSNFSAGANFVTGSATSGATTNSTIANPVVIADTSVAATASTLAPQGVATLSFRVKIKNAR